MLQKHSLLLLSALSITAQSALAADRADFSKMVVERPLKSIISPEQFREPISLKSTGLLETALKTPDKRSLSELHNSNRKQPLETSSATQPSDQGTRVHGKLAAGNPKVPAGLVAWHRNMEAAQRASVRSGKPILVFQMMGDLDKELC